MTRCPACGTELNHNAIRCASCGLTRPDLPQARNDAPLIGTTVAHSFLVEGVLGEGAMGVVYQARQLSLDKMVALKVLHRHLTGDQTTVRRFHREALAASRLNHRNSVHIIDFGQTDDGTLFIAMELIEGRDLHDLMKDTFPLSLSRVVDLVSQVCDALDEAHAAGIVHRDLKPENIMVVRRRDGREEVKVCDFGIAKIQDPISDNDHSPITQTGLVCGTPAYMSPEQCRGEPLDGRSDLYSVGVMLYQLVTGVLPFVAESSMGVVARQLHELPIPPTEVLPDSPTAHALEPAILRALEKKRRLRHANAQELKAALGQASSQAPHTPLPHRGAKPSFAPMNTLQLLRRRNPRWVWTAAVILLLLPVGAWWFRSHSTGTPPASSSTARSPVMELGSDDQVADVAGALPTPPPDGDPTPNGAASSAAAATGATDDPLPTRGVETAVANTEAGAGTEETIAPAHPAPRRRRPRPPTPPEKASTPVPSEYERGRRAFRTGEITQALSHLERAQRQSPRRADVHLLLGKCYFRVNRPREGKAAYRRYLQLRPDADNRAFIESIIAPGDEPTQ